MTLPSPSATAFAIVRPAFLALLMAAPTAPALTAQMTPPMAPAAPTMSGHASADSAQALVNFLTTVNRDEIASGKMAMSRATRADVKAYAERVISAHSKAMTDWAAKVGGLSLTIPGEGKAATKPAASMAGTKAMVNGMSEVRDTATVIRGGMGAAAIHSAHLAAVAELQKASRADFDQMYLEAELAGHDAVLKQLEMNPTTYTDLQTLLTQYRTMVDAHRIAVRKLLGQS